MSGSTEGHPGLKRQVVVRLDDAQLERLRKVSKASHRSMSQQVRHWIDDALNDKDPAALERPGS